LAFFEVIWQGVAIGDGGDPGEALEACAAGAATPPLMPF
jgi:hypothetical protein